MTKEDSEDLLEVYSDKNALPFFNSDNCHGDNFYYQTIERMNEAIDFWLDSYENKWFVRWTIIDKKKSKVPLYSVERAEAFTGYGFTKSDKMMVGTMDNYAYKDYWTISK